MFKKLINNIINAEDFDEAFIPVDMAFQRDEISWKDYEMLSTLCNKIFAD